MKNLVFLFSAFWALPFYSIAQDYFTVTAPSGLNLRAEPGVKGKKIIAIPFGAVVEMEESVYEPGTIDTIESKVGSWLEVKYRGQKGYVFSGFLMPGEAVVQSTGINRYYRMLSPGYHCSAANYDPSLYWYALVRKNNRLTVKKTSIMVKFRNDFSEKELAECVDCYTCKVEADMKDSVFFFIGTKQPLAEGTPFSKFLGDYWNYDGGAKFFYPEQDLLTYYPPYQYLFRAYEGVTLTYQPPGYEKKYQLEYSMILPTQDYQMKTFDLSKDLALKGDARQHGKYKTPQLIWYGDLNQDGLLDFIWYSHSMTDGCGVCWEYHLFMSDKNDPNQPIKKVADHVECNCLT